MCANHGPTTKRRSTPEPLHDSNESPDRAARPSEVAGFDEAIAVANDVPWSFQAAVFTRDMDRALRATSRLNASAVMVNDHPAFRIDGMPFAGLKQSGLGVGGIPYTMHDMQIEKMMVVHSPEL